MFTSPRLAKEYEDKKKYHENIGGKHSNRKRGKQDKVGKNAFIYRQIESG